MFYNLQRQGHLLGNYLQTQVIVSLLFMWTMSLSPRTHRASHNPLQIQLKISHLLLASKGTACILYLDTYLDKSLIHIFKKLKGKFKNFQREACFLHS